MRSFPRAVRSRATAVAVASLALALVTPTADARPVSSPASASDPSSPHDDKVRLQGQQDVVQRQQRTAQHDLDESSSQLRRAHARLAGSRTRLATARSSLSTAQTTLATARAEDSRLATALRTAEATLTRAQTALATGRKAVGDQHTTVVDSITGYYEQGDPQLLALTSILDSQTPGDVTRKLSLMDTVVSGQTQTWNDLQAAEVLLAARQKAVRAARNAVATKRRAAATQLARTRAAERAAASAAGGVRLAVTANATAVGQARRTRKSDVAELRRLERREKQIKAKILAAARRDRLAKRSAYQGATGGILLPPVSGPVTSPYGWRTHPIYGYWGLHDGTDFGAGCGQPLRAVAGGTVLEEYYSSVWGNRLYLNLGNYNGHNVTVIYNHLSSYRTRTGQTVGRGETVGYVGTTGWSTGCHLHFTVMVDGDPVDPMTWLS